MRSAPPNESSGLADRSLSSAPWTRAEALALAAIVALSWALHLIYVLQSSGSPFAVAPQMDALYHVEWARAFAEGARFQEGPFFRAPLYPWFLGTLFAVFGEDLALARLAQTGLGAACTLLVYLVGRRVFGRPAATVAALLSATYWVTIFYDAELLLEVLATPLYLVALWLTLGLGPAREREDEGDRPHAGLALAAGLVWGLGVITRPNALLCLPLLALWIAWSGAGSWRVRLRPTLLFGLGVLLPILPLSAYNASQGDQVLISSQAGVNLWIGNNPASDGHTAIVPGTRADWWGGYHDAIAAAEQAQGRALRPSEVSRYYSGRALEYARANPGAWAEQMLWKLRLFWMNWELGNNEEPRFLARRFSPLMHWLPLSFGVLAGLALAGLVAGRAQAGRTFPLWCFLFVFMGSVVLFFVNARFRLPVLPLLMVYAGYGVVSLWSFARAGRWGALAGHGALALAAWGASSRVPAVLILETEANAYLRLGQAEARAGHAEQALECYAEALEIYRGYTGGGAGAAPSGGFAKAVGLAAHAARMDLGREHFERTEFEAAAAVFERALEASPRSFEAAFSLGKSHVSLGEDALARVAFERALGAREPVDESYLLEAYREAARLSAGAGDLPAAVALCERMVARFPDEPRAAELLRRLRGLSGE